jgi:hypothetical protein
VEKLLTDDACTHLLAPVLTDVAFQRVDQVLQQVKALGRQGASVHATSARFGGEVILLSDRDPHYDWLLPAAQKRLEGPLSDFKCEIDPGQMQVVDLARGQPFRFLGFELHCVLDRHGKARVTCNHIKLGPQKTTQTSDSPKEGPKRVPARAGILARRADWVTQFVARIRGVLAAPVPFRAIGSFFCAHLYQGMVALSGRCRQNWELCGMMICVLLMGYLLPGWWSKGPSERAVANDMPGLFTGRYQSTLHPKPVEYALYVPPWDGPDLRPCIVYLYGSDNVKQIVREGLATAIRQRLRQGEDFEFAVFLPACSPGRAGENRMYSLIDTLDYLIERHHLDPKRVYLMGHRHGAASLWPLATHYPDRWGAIVAIGPLSVPSVAAVPRIPCWIFHSRQKKDRPDPEIDAFGQELVRRGGDVFTTEYSKESEVYGSPKVFNWLARQRRS